MRYRDIPLDFHSSVISGRLGRAEDGHRCSRMARRTHANNLYMGLHGAPYGPTRVHIKVVSMCPKSHSGASVAILSPANCPDGSQETLKNVPFGQHCVVVFRGVWLYLLVFNCIQWYLVVFCGI